MDGARVPHGRTRVPRDPLHSMGVRVMDVGNYCVYCIPKNGIVSIGRILYRRRDADAALAKGWLESR